MRKLSLATGIITGIATALRLITPLSGVIDTIRLTPGTKIWAYISAMAMPTIIAIVFVLVLLFFLALFHDQGMIVLSQRLRFLGRVAALIVGTIAAADLPLNLRVFENWTAMTTFTVRTGTAALWGAIRDPASIAVAGNLLDLVSEILLIALLIVLARDPLEELSDIPIGSFLRQVSAMAVIGLGLVLAVQLLRVGLVPWAYPQLRVYAYQTGVTPQSLSDLLLPQIRALAGTFCLFVTPFLVYSASRK